MARPKKQGIDYFPLDVDFFSNIKIRKIARACGPQATSILICLLCNIYKENGYYILWDEDLPFVIADSVGVSEGAVKEVILKAIYVGFFDKDIYEKHKVLTSYGIQNRFKSAVYKREEIEFIEDFLVSDIRNRVFDVRNSVSDTGSTQSKVNRKNKENSTNVEEKKAKPSKDAAKAAALSRKEAFYQSLIPFLETYPKDMIRGFFDYWSEMNKSGMRMRFELEKTWELPRRLATWAKREKMPSRANTSIGVVLTDNDPGKYDTESEQKLQARWNR